MGIKVVKFGGSSLADEKQFKKVSDIIFSDPDRRYVVPSAPGKRFHEDTKVTDMLYSCYEKMSRGTDAEDIFKAIKQRYEQIVYGLGIEFDLETEFTKIEQAFKNKAGRDYAASRGEFLNGKILAKYIGFEFIDAAECIFFNNDGSFNGELTNTVLSEKLSHVERAVIPGFFGVMPNDTIKTFSRGGSDITGAIVARAANADIYENWTDVSGLLTADPRIVKDPATIEFITYRELRELSYMGATVLHEDAIFPVKATGIPINIRNTNSPEDCGTMIVPSTGRDDDEANGIITGIAGKKDFAVITLEKDRMNEELGFGRCVLEVLEKNKLVFEHLPSGIDTMSVIIDGASLKSKEREVINGLFEATGSDSIDTEYGMSLVSVVGHGMKNVKGTAARIFSCLAANNINIRMIDQGSSELNIIVGVDNNDFEKSIRTIYNEFFGKN